MEDCGLGENNNETAMEGPVSARAFIVWRVVWHQKHSAICPVR